MIKNLQKNIAFSRAEDGLIIIGSAGMTRNHDSTTPVKAWTKALQMLEGWKQQNNLRFW